MNDRANHNHCTTQFIELANQLKEEGHDVQLISAALMSASCIYTTYSVAGNQGALEESGVEKVLAMYKHNLEHIQALKRTELEQQAEPAPE